MKQKRFKKLVKNYGNITIHSQPPMQTQVYTILGRSFKAGMITTK